MGGSHHTHEPCLMSCIFIHDDHYRLENRVVKSLSVALLQYTLVKSSLLTTITTSCLIVIEVGTIWLVSVLSDEYNAVQISSLPPIIRCIDEYQFATQFTDLCTYTWYKLPGPEDLITDYKVLIHGQCRAFPQCQITITSYWKYSEFFPIIRSY